MAAAAAAMLTMLGRQKESEEQIRSADNTVAVEAAVTGVNDLGTARRRGGSDNSEKQRRATCNNDGNEEDVDDKNKKSAAIHLDGLRRRGRHGDLGHDDGRFFTE